MNTTYKLGTDLTLPQAADMERAATELASDALILGAGLRQITADLREVHLLLGLGAIRKARELVEVILLLLSEAGY